MTTSLIKKIGVAVAAIFEKENSDCLVREVPSPSWPEGAVCDAIH
jgi:hypothetical protein